MEQKRFLTADEVFQLFGVDANSLDALVESGAVKALADLGTFKYRSEDFVALVKAGKLTPRTSGEMFQVDSKGDIPFLKVKNDDYGLKFDDEVSFLELDEEALDEQAGLGSPQAATPHLPENWFEDSDDAVAIPKTSDTSGEVHIIQPAADPEDEETDFELNIAPEMKRTPDSDSDVQIVDDNAGIVFDEPDFISAGSDSDVRLDGPISSAGSPPVIHRKKPDSDSDVRLAQHAPELPHSDSDVVVSSLAGTGSGSPGSIAQPGSKRPEGDSGIQLVSPANPRTESIDSDSDVVLVSSPPDTGRQSPGKAKKPDSDSDVRLSQEAADISKAAVTQSASVGTFDAESGDSDIRLEAEHAAGQSPVPAGQDFVSSMLDDSGSSIRLSNVESDIHVDNAFDDSGITLDASSGDSGIALEDVGEQSEITHEIDLLDSGISLETSDADSGIKLESAVPDSGISLDSDKPDSGISLESKDSDSDVSLDFMQSDSGISLQSADDDSGIMLEGGDSGIRFESAGDSGITFEDDVLHPGQTVAESDDGDFELVSDPDMHSTDARTQTVDLSGEHPQDSGFDVSLADPDQTSELHFDSSEMAATVADKGHGKTGTQPLSLSEAFKLDEPLEVEDLDISDDLDAAAEGNFSDEFAAMDEDVVEASDADFGDALDEEVAVAEDDEFSDSEAMIPAAKVRTSPKEPQWGMLAVAPIIGASSFMAATVTCLWGGIATMWTGAEASGVSGTLISTLAGLF